MIDIPAAFTLTAAGEALYQHAQRILGAVDHLAADLSDYAEGVLGVVRLWANTSATNQFLPGDLATFATAQPGVRIELHEADSHEVVLAVLEGRADLGIFAERTPPLGLHTLLYRTDRLVMVVPVDHPLAQRRRIAFADAVPYDFISLSSRTSPAEQLSLASGHLGQPLRIRIQVRSFDAMCQMVSAGLGIAVLPEKAVQPLLKALRLRKIELSEEWVERGLLCGVRDANALPKPARKLLDHFERRRASA